MKKMLFIYNPRSGKGLIRNSLSTILEIFTAAGYEVTVHPTEGEKDARNTVQQRAHSFELVVCCGGDGTLDEVVAGMMDSGVQRAIGYIPAGSTNDFGSSLGIPKQMDQAARLVVDGREFACDIGRLNEEYFVYVAAFGAFTDISYETDQDLKNILGHAAYLIEGMKRMGTWKSTRMRVESEEFTDEGDFVFGMITNSNSVGGIRGLPGSTVELNDGLFEVMLVRAPQTLADWQDVITAVLTKEESTRNVVRFKTRSLRMFSDEPVAWTRDGENGGKHTQVELVNIPQTLHIIVDMGAEPVLHEIHA